MAIDRNAVPTTAETLLRHGRLGRALQRSVCGVAEQPLDCSSLVAFADGCIQPGRRQPTGFPLRIEQLTPTQARSAGT